MSNSKCPPILKPFQLPFQNCIKLGVYLLKGWRDTQLCEGWQHFHSKLQFGPFLGQEYQMPAFISETDHKSYNKNARKEMILYVSQINILINFTLTYCAAS